MNAIPHLQGFIADAAQRASKGARVSFEFSPPKTRKSEAALWENIGKLAPLRPNFVSVTYGAGGSTRERTHAVVSRIVKETALQPAAHLTCVAASRGEIDEVLRAYWDAGVRHVVALRGDPPGNPGGAYVPHPEGYAYAADLVAAAKAIAPFEVSVAVHPERHPSSPSWQAEIDNTKRKADAGAARGITNFFVDADSFLRFRDRLAAANVTLPIVPGIMPVTNFVGFRKMAAVNGASIPDWFAKLFDGLDDDPETRKLVAAAATAELCARLSAEGVEDFHFYTVNRADLTLAICRVIGVKGEGTDDV
ncbi:MAG TPA: methylenetetrahydrofolate reductase [NAD(P)H] [Caulobacterales bacterium]|nr:methylenetetrahydrofolate reductase [NAD(P)H] [Caulobacterales bacterium]